MLVQRTALALAALALAGSYAFAQTTTGTLLGAVVDPGDAAVPAARVELVNIATGAVVATTTGAEGLFRFNSLVPATYNLTVTPASGFKTYTQANIEVTANEIRDLGKITLALGAITEKVTVSATATPVQTGSSENSKLIDPNQLANITLKGRDLFGMLVTIPGVGFTSTGPGDTTNENTVGRVRINGAPYASANFTVDGITDLDTGSNGTSHYAPNMDSIAEMRVLTSNYQAEYGRNMSGTISVVTKGGSQEFHGSAWANKRHEMFNAKNFFNNYNGQQKSVYRFFVWGYSIGGPVYIPKLFNTQKRKLFFFWSQEYTKQKPATLSGYANMPTAAQRAGDFSGYTDGNGVPVALTDPTTGNPVPNNNIAGLAALNPAAAKAGQAILNFLPLPNICGQPGVDPSHCVQDAQFASQRYQRNYYWSYNETHPRRNDTVRVDYNVTSKLTSWFRYINDFDRDTTATFGEVKNAQGQLAPLAIDHPNPGHGYGVGITYTISPTLVNEFTFGKSYNTWDYYAHDQSQIDRSQMGNPPSFINFATDPNFQADQNKSRPTLSPGSQNFQIGIPDISFGGGQEPNEASYSSPCSAQCPYTNWNDIYSFNDTISKVWGKHNVKAGLYYERTGKVEQNQFASAYLGSYNFASSSAMPNNTQDGYANAFLGQFNSYNEGGRVVGNYWFTDVEAFIQDNWRVSRRVTIDVGVRFYHQLPTENLDYNTTEWVRTSYNPAQAMRLYYPGCTVSTATRACPTANQIAIDPVTGYTTYFALAGTFVPASAGGYGANPTPAPGMERATNNNPNLPLSLWNVRSVIPAFRFGIAWDVFGNGKTAIRTGFGQFYNLSSTQNSQNFSGNPPDIYNRAVYYSSVDKIPSLASSAGITPITPGGTVGDQKVPGTINGSFMIQQKIGFGTVLETAYVFNLSRHRSITRQLNAVPMYAEYNPANYNPNVAYLPPNTNGKNLNDNYFRPLPGLGALTYIDYAGSSSYNSLQVTVRRNFTQHLSYGLAYTWSKTMTAYGASEFPTQSPYFPDKFRNYGPLYQPTPHVLSFNYVYEVPNLGQRMNMRPLGWVTDHWTISGITQWHSNLRIAAPGISFSGTTSTNPQMNWTGGYEGARMFIVGNTQLSSGQVSFAGNTPLVPAPGANANGTPGNQILNMSAFVIPFPCSWTPGATPQQGVGQSMECFGNAGAGSIIPLPGTQVFNWDVTFGKAFPLKSEKRQIIFRAEMYNIFNHTQFTAANTSPQYNWPLWQTGVLQQTNANLGRYTAAANPRQMSMSLRLQF